MKGICFFGILSTKVISVGILRNNLRFPKLFFGLIFKRKGISSRISQISQGSRRNASFFFMEQLFVKIYFGLKYEKGSEVSLLGQRARAEHWPKPQGGEQVWEGVWVIRWAMVVNWGRKMLFV